MNKPNSLALPAGLMIGALICSVLLAMHLGSRVLWLIAAPCITAGILIYCLHRFRAPLTYYLLAFVAQQLLVAAYAYYVIDKSAMPTVGFATLGMFLAGRELSCLVWERKSIKDSARKHGACQ